MTIVDANEGWQVVGPCQRRAHHRESSPSPQYLTVVASRCLNCLSPSIEWLLVISSLFVLTAMVFDIDCETTNALGIFLPGWILVALWPSLLLLANALSELGGIVPEFPLCHRCHVTSLCLM
jgi:hypothetical protein